MVDTSPRSSRSIELLYVDDDSALLELTQTYLESEYEGFRVTTVSNVDTAINTLEAGSFDAIVSDYQMPGKDGLDFLQYVREELDSNVPFVIFTGRGREEVSIRALNLGADRYVQKGGDPASQYGVLAKGVEQAVEHDQTRRQLKRREENLRITLDSIGDAVITTDQHGRITRMNDVATEITGWDTEAAVGQSVETVFDIYAHETGESIEDPVTKVLEEGEQVGLGNGTVLRRRDDTEVFIADSAAPITDGETVIGVVLVFRDVTERYRRRQKRKAQREAIVELATDDAIVHGEFTEAIRRISRTTAELLEVDRTNIWLFDDADPDTMRCVVEYDTRTGFGRSSATLTADEFQPYFDALHTHRALDADNARKDPRTACLTEAYLEPENVDALLDATIRSGGEMSGIVCCEQRGVREWSEDDIRFAGEMADLVQRTLSNREGARRAGRDGPG